MRKRRIVLLCVVALIIAMTSQPALAAAEGTVQGTIAIPPGSVAIVDIFDEAISMRSAQLLAPGESFEFNALSPGTYRLRYRTFDTTPTLATYDWYNSSADATTFEAAETITVTDGSVTDLTLTPTVRAGGALSFTIEDAATGMHPVSDCLTVTAHEAVSGIGIGLSAATDEIYPFVLGGLPPGSYVALFADFGGGATCDGTSPTYFDQWFDGVEGTNLFSPDLLPTPGIDAATPVVISAGGVTPVHFIVNAFSPTVACGATVTTDVTLTSNLRCSGTDGLIVGADGIEIDLNGFTIRNIGGGTPTGIVVDGHGDVTVRNGRIRDFHTNVSFVDSPRGIAQDLVTSRGDTGVGFLRSPESVADGVTARTNAEAGLVATDSADVVLRDITARNNTVGIAVLSDGLTIENATLANNLIGVDAQSVDGLSIADSTLRNNSSAGVSTFHATNTTVTRSTLRGNGYGLRLGGDSTGSVISENTANANSVGIWIGVAHGVTVHDNTANRNDASGIVVDQDDFVVGSPIGQIVGNTANRNGTNPGSFTDLLGAALDDGIHIYAPVGIVEATANTTNANGDLGIDANVATDGGSNLARRNGNPAQCAGIACS